MKNGLLKFIALVGIVLLSSKCGDSSIELKKEFKREFTSSVTDPVLSDFKSKFSKDAILGRVKNSINNRINWNKAYRTFNPSKNRTSYTIPLLVEEKGVFQNLIINITDEQEERYILRYKPSNEWLKQKPRRGGFSSYSGTIDIQEIDGSIRASSAFDNGKAIPIKLNKNGRSNACFAAFEMTWTEVTVNGNTYITEIDVYEYVYCETPGNGGGPGGGIGGSTGSGGGPSGPGTGIFDPIDVSYFLTPAFEGDDLNNPYHGMKAHESNGVEYTWDDSIKAWLMPDIVILLDNGYQLAFDESVLTTGLDGRILSTVTTIALVEPTFIGEILLLGMLLYIYDANQINTANSNIDHCTRQFVLCTGKYAYKNLPCSSCQQYCMVQGYWDSGNCPLR